MSKESSKLRKTRGNQVCQVQLESSLSAHWPSLLHQAPATVGNFLLRLSGHLPPGPAGVWAAGRFGASRAAML